MTMMKSNPRSRRLRSALLAGLVMGAAALPAAAVDPAYSGSWYNPAESGSGFNLEIFSDSRALLFWYTYDSSGEAVWLYSEGAISGERIDFDVYYSQGMRFGDLDPADNDTRRWGSLSMQFSDCNTATISYASTLTGFAHSPQGTGTVDVQRLVSIDGLPCRTSAGGYWVGRHFDPELGRWADLAGVTTEDGRLFFSSLESDEVMIGSYVATGGSLDFEYQVCEGGEPDCYQSTGSALFAGRDWINGTSTSPVWGTQPMELSYRTLYERDVTTTSIAGNYTLSSQGVTYAITVLANGALTGSDDQGCQYSGQLTPIDGNFNAFAFEGTVSACTSDSWQGVVVNTDNEVGDRDQLEFRVATGYSQVQFVLDRIP